MAARHYAGVHFCKTTWKTLCEIWAWRCIRAPGLRVSAARSRVHAADPIFDPPKFRSFPLLLDCRSGSLLHAEGLALPTETKVESEMSQSKRGTSVNLSNSGTHKHGVELNPNSLARAMMFRTLRRRASQTSILFEDLTRPWHPLHHARTWNK